MATHHLKYGKWLCYKQPISFLRLPLIVFQLRSSQADTSCRPVLYFRHSFLPARGRLLELSMSANSLDNIPAGPWDMPKTRKQVQSLQTIDPISKPNNSDESRNFRQKIDLWMINEGGRQASFAVWIFLHLIVALFGFLNFQLGDNLVGARH